MSTSDERLGDGHHAVWSPKEDITAYELALALPILLGGRFPHERLTKLPDRVRRHFSDTR